MVPDQLPTGYLTWGMPVEVPVAALVTVVAKMGHRRFFMLVSFCDC